MSDFQVTNIGPLSEWGAHFGGFTDQTQREGRRVVDHALDMQFIGVTSNAMAPGDQAGYWHAHTEIEELYMFLDGEGEMALDDQVIPVVAGSTVRVGQHVRRTWRCSPDSPTTLKWLCIRAGGDRLAAIPTDAERDTKTPMPW
ncbi:cupin domain-containing protein [Demequina aurantiaca]|uniref:cupin domain-containing protein n=1 Tax=Demequina aurantiaca TaxID=676200 RepID=UPI003D3502D3